MMLLEIIRREEPCECNIWKCCARFSSHNEKDGDDHITKLRCRRLESCARLFHKSKEDGDD